MATPLERPRIVGRYAIYGPIATGGMATVHLGRLLGPVGFLRTVAVKRLHPQFASDPEFVAMFLDEARLAARIRHPNVAQTLDVVAGEGELFLVMDYVQGETLSRLRTLGLQQGEGIPLRVATSVLCGALHGLHCAHEATSDRGESLDIVHRDVSPQNVLVGVDGVARLLDFGVAKAIGRSHTTREGQLKGKLAYMAPEQLDGQATRRTDIFAASVVLWEALTGDRLFQGEDERATIGKVLKLDVEPPSARIAAQSRPAHATAEELKRLDAVTLRGLARDPKDRFETAREMALALEGCVGVASPTEVGAWVERVAGPSLRKRKDEVATIEENSSSPVELLTPPSPDSTPPSRDSMPAAAEPASRVHDTRPDVELTSPTMSGATLRSASKGRRSGWSVLVAGVATTALLGLAASRFLARPPAPAAAPSAFARVAAEAPAAPVAASTPAPAVVDTAAATAPTASAPTAPRPAPASAPRRPSRRASCDPPYTVDAAGHQRFKEECFR